MLNIFEICRRAQTGPAIDAESFDLDMVFTHSKKLCEKPFTLTPLSCKRHHSP